VMGQSPLDYLNVIDCWLESGKFIVRIDNNAVVDRLKSMDPKQLQEAMKGMKDIDIQDEN